MFTTLTRHNKKSNLRVVEGIFTLAAAVTGQLALTQSLTLTLNPTFTLVLSLILILTLTCA